MVLSTEEIGLFKCSKKSVALSGPVSLAAFSRLLRAEFADRRFNLSAHG